MSVAGMGDHLCNAQNCVNFLSPVVYVRRVVGAIAMADRSATSRISPGEGGGLQCPGLAVLMVPAAGMPAG